MDKKLTRRAVLGTLIAGLATLPFGIRAWHRRRQIQLPDDSLFPGLYTRFLPFLDFPRKFDIEYDDRSWVSMSGPTDKSQHRKILDQFYALPKNVRDTIVETQWRYWQNFAQIDELEFDCTHFRYNEDGTKKTDYGDLEGHVRLKYGHGLEIVGKDALGESIRWAFNLDGNISAIARKFNVSSMMLEFFSAYEALPPRVLGFDHVHSTTAELPENPYLTAKDGDRYTILSIDRYLQFIKLPPHIEGTMFYGKYYNSRTGMPDYLHYRNFGPDKDRPRVIFWRQNPEGRVDYGDGDRYLNSLYEDPSVPLPPKYGTTQYWKNVEVEKGIFLPVEYVCISDDYGLFSKATYSNIRVKRY